VRPELIGLVRLYCSKGKETNVFDFPRAEARAEAKRLNQEGWIIYYTVDV